MPAKWPDWPTRSGRLFGDDGKHYSEEVLLGVEQDQLPPPFPGETVAVRQVGGPVVDCGKLTSRTSLFATVDSEWHGRARTWNLTEHLLIGMDDQPPT